jgi:hypothetical protein
VEWGACARRTYRRSAPMKLKLFIIRQRCFRVNLIHPVAIRIHQTTQARHHTSPTNVRYAATFARGRGKHFGSNFLIGFSIPLFLPEYTPYMIYIIYTSIMYMYMLTGYGKEKKTNYYYNIYGTYGLRFIIGSSNAILFRILCVCVYVI